MELEVERNHIRCSLSAGEKFNSLLAAAIVFPARAADNAGVSRYCVPANLF